MTGSLPCQVFSNLPSKRSTHCRVSNFVSCAWAMSVRGFRQYDLVLLREPWMELICFLPLSPCKNAFFQARWKEISILILVLRSALKLISFKDKALRQDYDPWDSVDVHGLAYKIQESSRRIWLTELPVMSTVVRWVMLRRVHISLTFNDEIQHKAPRMILLRQAELMLLWFWRVYGVPRKKTGREELWRRTEQFLFSSYCFISAITWMLSEQKKVEVYAEKKREKW